MGDRQSGQEQRPIPLKRLYSEREWINIFRRYDYDEDDQIPVKDFIEELRISGDDNVPILEIEKALNEADTNEDNVITLQEFLKLVQKTSEGKSKYGLILTKYIRKTIPPRQKRSRELEEYQTATDGEYEEEYKFWPPPFGMALVSLLEIITFFSDALVSGYGRIDGPIASVLTYNPYLRKEAWRFLTYAFVHAGVQHLFTNIAVQIILGLPLEMVHGWWRILIIYTSGIIAGSLATSVFDPKVFLVGASGGVYSIITAHLASIIMNWSEMELAKWQLLTIILLCTVDLGSAIYTRYFLDIDDKIGYVGHLAGAVAGLLIGINVLKNLEVRSWENKVWWAAVVIYILLMTTGIIINIAFPSYFPTKST